MQRTSFSLSIYLFILEPVSQTGDLYLQDMYINESQYSPNDLMTTEIHILIYSTFTSVFSVSSHKQKQQIVVTTIALI